LRIVWLTPESRICIIAPPGVKHQWGAKMREPMDAPAEVALESELEREDFERSLKSDFDRIFTEELGFFCARGVSDIPQWSLA